CDNTLAITAICLNTDAHDLLRTEVQVMAMDLAGNVESIVRSGSAMVPEDSAVLDAQPPGQAKAPSGALGGPVLCQQVSTSKVADLRVPRVRTANRTFPLSWDPALSGCNSGAVESDNNVVEATRIAYAIAAPSLSLGPDNMTGVFVPGRDQQLARVANASIDGLGLGSTFINNRTMYAMAQGEDMAGNLQLAHLCVCAHVLYDDRAPDVALLNLTYDHGQADLRWFAADREAGGRVVRSYLAWGAPGAAGADNLTVIANATQVGTTAILHLGGLSQDTLYSAQIVSLDDVGNARVLPALRFRTDPVANVTISSPQPGDLLHGDATLRFNVSDVRQDALLTYNVSIVEALADGSMLELPVETFTRTECLAPSEACPTPQSAIQVSRALLTDRFPDSAQVFLRIAVNNSLDPGQPHVVSVGPFTIDNAPPLTKLGIVAQGGPVWFRSSAVLVLEPGDNTTSVVFTEYSFDNFTFLAYNASSPPVLDTEGQVPFFFRSTDVVGNVEPLRTVYVNIDRQKPTGALSIDLGAAATGDPNVTVFIQAEDGLSGVGNVTLDAGLGSMELDHPARFASGRSIPVQLPGGQGERRVRVRVADLAGNVEELKARILVDQVAPTITGVSVDSVEHTAATVSWQTDEPSPSRVDLGPQGAAVLATRFEVPDLARAHTLSLTGLRPSTTYAFRVVATDALGNRAAQDGLLTTLPDVQPPGAPTSLAAEDLGNGVTRLAWLPAFDDVGIDHYVVLRGVAGQLDELARTAETQFFDDTALPGVAYDYAVQAVDLASQPGPLSGIVRGKATTAPELLSWHVSPETGPASQTFTYTVVVKDPDGDTPASVRVRITGTALEMRPDFTGTADFSRGVTYVLATKLPTTTLEGGFPTYQFEASDGVHTALAPDVPAAGPAVLGFGAIIPGLSAATTLFGLPGFEAVLSLLAIAGAAGLTFFLRRRRDA
ncbi:MAG: fibronectin type III domain-containing protein, partial [Halobacteriales archaeon]|nr:fibronectin type III domain-containing protein [Halobacteriales archaeon]